MNHISPVPSADEATARPVYTSVTAPGVHEIDPASLIWPGENKEKALLNSGVDDLSVWVHRLGASDLHLQAGEPAKINLHGRWFPAMSRPITEREIQNAMVHLYGPGAIAWLLDGNDFRIGHTVKIMAQANGRYVIGGHRAIVGGAEERYGFRWHGAGVRIYGTNSCQMTARVIERVPPQLSDLGLEDGILEHCKPDDGLVLITGKPSQGKTRLMAAIELSYLQDPNFHGKVLELAHPQEYVFDGLSGPTNMYAVSEIGQGGNYKTGQLALEGTFFRAHQVVVAPEMKDVASTHLALLSAQSGTTTFATTHTSGVPATMERLLVIFPHAEREERAISMMQNLRLIVSCKLVPSTDGRRFQLREFLPFTALIRRQLLAKPYTEWPFLCESLLKSNGQSFVMAAEAAIDQGRISEEVALPFLEEH